MSLAEQMRWVERLIRRPADLSGIDAHAELSAEDRAVLATIDPDRLEAVGRAQALLAVARWWQGRFPATLATLAHLLGGELPAARRLMQSDAFERAVDEDVTAAAFVGATLEVCADALAEAPEWLEELLAYEYLLSTALPRRARGEPVCAETEARLLPQAAWLSGGRLRRGVLCCPFAWPVATLAEEPHDAEPDPHALLFLLGEQEAVEVDADEAVADALTLLADGADDALLAEALGTESATQALALLRELEVLDGRQP